MKNYYTETNVGHAKYIVNFHDGFKTYSDGSEFYDIRIFKNKKSLNLFIASLVKDGYVELSKRPIYQ